MGSIVALALLMLLSVGDMKRGPAKMFGSTAPAALLWEGAAGREPVRFVPIRIL